MGFDFKVAMSAFVHRRETIIVPDHPAAQREKADMKSTDSIRFGSSRRPNILLDCFGLGVHRTSSSDALLPAISASGVLRQPAGKMAVAVRWAKLHEEDEHAAIW